MSRSGAGDCGGQGPRVVCRGLVIQGRVRAFGVVVRDPGGDHDTCMSQVPEHGLVEQLVAHSPIEAFDETVLHGLSRRDVVPFYPMLGAPPQDRVTGQFRPIIADNHFWLSAALDQRCQFTRHPAPRYRRVWDGSQAFARDVIDHVENAEALAVGELVMDEIQRPARIGPRLDQDRGPRPNSFAPSAPLAHRQPFLAVEPIDPVDPRGLTLAAQQDEQASVTEPPTLVGQIA